MNKDFGELKNKRITDFFFSLFIIVLISPVLMIIAIAIRIDDGGTVFITQERTGINGHRFPVYKFRTMRASPLPEIISLSGNDSQSGPVFKIMNDPKVTRIGRLLRKTSFDELPMYFNVIRGEISVAGFWPGISFNI